MLFVSLVFRVFSLLLICGSSLNVVAMWFTFLNGMNAQHLKPPTFETTNLWFQNGTPVSRDFHMSKIHIHPWGGASPAWRRNKNEAVSDSDTELLQATAFLRNVSRVEIKTSECFWKAGFTWFNVQRKSFAIVVLILFMWQCAPAFLETESPRFSEWQVRLSTRLMLFHCLMFVPKRQRFASDASVCDHGVGLQHQKKCRWNVKKVAISECSQEFNAVTGCRTTNSRHDTQKNDAT